MGLKPQSSLSRSWDRRARSQRPAAPFLVSSDGKFLTNYHVIAHSKQATVRLANGDAYDTVEVLSIDKRKDIGF